MSVINCRLIGDKAVLDCICTVFAMNGLKPTAGNDYPVAKGSEVRRYVQLTTDLEDIHDTICGSSTLVIAFLEAIKVASAATGENKDVLRRKILKIAGDIYSTHTEEEARQYCIENMGIDPHTL